jgi:hypothetical protein
MLYSPDGQTVPENHPLPIVILTNDVSQANRGAGRKLEHAAGQRLVKITINFTDTVDC